MVSIVSENIELPVRWEEMSEWRERMSINADNLAQSLLCRAELRFIHGVYYSHNHSIRSKVDSIYGRNKLCFFQHRVSQNLVLTNTLFWKVSVSNFCKIGTINVLSTSQTSFVPISKVRLSPYRFSRKSQLVNSIDWRYRVTIFTQTVQEIRKILARIHFRQ
jgi:hypothetical protein